MDQQEFMKMAWSDIMKDRRAERIRSYVKYGLMVAAVLTYIAVVLISATQANKPIAEPYVSLVKIQGEIGAGKEASSEALRPLLTKAFKDSDAKGVVLLINSPGGTPVQAGIIHDHILRLKKQYKKKVYAVGEDTLASGAYMVAVAADQIYVNRSTVTGSIGVISRGFGVTGLMEKLGVERRVMTAGSSKNMMDPFGPETAKDREKQGRLLAAIHEHFKDTVQLGRGSRLTGNEDDLFSGMVWTGDEATKLGITDAVGDLDDVMAKLGAATVREYAPAKSLLDLALGTVGTRISQALQPTTQIPLATLE